MERAGGPFREMTDARLLLIVFVADPIAQAATALALALALAGRAAVARWGALDAARFSLCLWGASAMQGIALDYDTDCLEADKFGRAPREYGAIVVPIRVHFASDPTRARS